MSTIRGTPVPLVVHFIDADGEDGWCLLVGWSRNIVVGVALKDLGIVSKIEDLQI